jgi:Spy/CpxP family protein refolding chaperone
MSNQYSRRLSSIIKPHLNALILGGIALVSSALSFTMVQLIVPSSVTSVQAMPSGPDFSKLSLSAEQQKQLQKIQLDTKPEIMKVLTPTQQTQLETKLVQGQTLWQGLASLDLSKTQQSKVQNIMKSQRFKIVRLLTPEQRSQLMRSTSGRPPF